MLINALNFKGKSDVSGVAGAELFSAQYCVLTRRAT